MKGIKGERKYYGIRSPFHSLYAAAGIKYLGTRGQNGYQKAPWYIYGTDPGTEFPDFAEFFGALMRAGWKPRKELDKDTLQAFPATGERRGGGQYESYNLEIEHKGALHTLHVLATTYPKKPARNYISVNEITYPPL